MGSLKLSREGSAELERGELGQASFSTDIETGLTSFWCLKQQGI